MNNSKLIIAIKLFRLPSAIAMNLFLFCPIFFATRNIAFSILQTIPFILMISGAIALNDCCDIEKDRINKPHRPLVSGILEKNDAIILTIIALVIAIVLGFLIYRNNAFRLLIFLSVTILLLCYNFKFAIIPLLKTGMTALATVFSLAFVCTFIAPDNTFFFFMAAAFFFILGREFMMDIRDMEGDKKEGYKTLAVIFGKRKLTLAFIFSFGISTIFCLLCILSNFQIFKLVLFILIVLSEIFFCYMFITSKNSKQQNRSILLLWMPIVLMLFNFF